MADGCRGRCQAAQGFLEGALDDELSGYLEHWAPLHGMTVGEALANSEGSGIARYGAPEEIAELMAFLVSPGARWMTGSALRMDEAEVKSI